MTESPELFQLRMSEKFHPTLNLVKQFIAREIIPIEEELKQVNEQDRWALHPQVEALMEEKKAKAQDLGLWNFFLPDWNGDGISNLDYAYLAEEMGKVSHASEIFNCSAPDTGNMEVLHKYGSEAQKKQWLEPLLCGEIRSAFAMTEPDLASSDASNISTRAVLDGNEWVINGEKFYISGAGDKRCKILITMVLTDPDAPKYLRQSQILVPIDTPGVTVLGPMTVFGQDHAPHGHMHIEFKDVRVPHDNIILGAGSGFEISQGRLGPGRVHHCMRLIGQAEKALALMIERGKSRQAFGKEIITLGGSYDVVARSRIEIDSCRLQVYKTARAMDILEPKEARIYIHQIKAMIPEIVCNIIDRAIQMHGAAGVSQWSELPDMYMSARALRFADGPDEVHRMVVARNEINKHG